MVVNRGAVVEHGDIRGTAFEQAHNWKWLDVEEAINEQQSPKRIRGAP